MGIRKGNIKLGRNMTWLWSMTPGVEGSCTGESEDCKVHCYAKKGRMGYMPSCTSAQAQNYELSKTSYFVNWMILEIKRVQAKLFRIHVVGDFYDEEYIRKWIKIIQACPDTTFYAYTRSWNVKSLKGPLNKLARLPNVRLWWSCDRSMPKPNPIKDVRLAYLQIENDDVPDYKVDLFFRIKQLRKRIVKSIGGVFVCPPENGISKKVTCEKCSYCWKPLQTAPSNKNRISLPILA